jgi:ribosomal protein S18
MAVSKPRPRRKKRRIFHRRKVCRFCADQSLVIDYKDPKTLKYFTTERGKDHSSANFGCLCQTPAGPDPCHQTCTDHCPDALCRDIRSVVCQGSPAGRKRAYFQETRMTPLPFQSGVSKDIATGVMATLVIFPLSVFMPVVGFSSPCSSPCPFFSTGPNWADASA